MSGPHLFLFLTGVLGAMAFSEVLPEPPGASAIPAPSTTEALSVPAAEAPADAEIVAPAELTVVIREQDAAVKALEQKDAEARAALRDWYSSSLDTMREEAVSSGDLDHVLALDLERQRVDTEITPEEKAKLFYNLRELRSRFERQRADLLRHASAELGAGVQRYAVALDQLAGVFRQNGNLAAARFVERTRLSMLGAAPTSAVAAAPPGNSSWGNSVPPAPDPSGSGSNSGSRSTSTGSWGGVSGTVQGTAPANGTFKLAATGGTFAAKGAPAWGPGKPATGPASAPSASSLSAPPRVQAAQQTLKNAASQISTRGSAPARPASSAGFGGPAPRGGPGVWGR